MTDTSSTLTLRPPVWALLTAVIIAGGFYIGGKYIEVDDRDPPMISVTGEGKVSIAPDVAELSFGVTTGRKQTASLAMESLKKSMEAAFSAVKDQGIEEKDIRTENFSLYPAYDWSNGRQTLLGYEANQSLRVKVRDLDKVSTVLGAATSAGANQAGSVSFIIDDPEGARAQAREEAIVQAKEKAQVLARQLGMSLGEIRGFNEGGGYSPPMPYAARGMEMDASEEKLQAQATPLPAGEQEIQITVSISYELE